MSNLPIKEVRHEEEHSVCRKCGSEMMEIGEEKAYDELVYVSSEFFVRRHIVKTYKCTKCGQDPDNDVQNTDEIERCIIRCADYPKPMIPHSFCSPGLAAHITYEKFAKAVPLYRQEKDFAAKDIPILRATMSE
jgi:transposase